MTALAVGAGSLAARGTDIRLRLGLAAGVACLAAVVVATGAARAGGITGSPSLPPGDWRQAWQISLVAAFAFYALGAWLLWSVTGGRWAAIGIAAAIQALPLSAPLQLSGDANVYASIARSSHPYSTGPFGSVYGPLWTMISRGVVAIGHPEYVFRLIGFAAVMTAIAIVTRLSTRETIAIAVLGWNPLLAFHFAGGGHNDAVMMALALGGILAANLGRPRLGGAAWAGSIFVKLSSAPLYLLWAIERRSERKSVGVAGAAIAAAVLAAVSFAVYGTSWLDMFSSLHDVEQVPAPFGMVGWLVDLGLTSGHAVIVSDALELVVLVVFGLQARRSKLRLGLAAGVLTLVGQRIEPWYAIWAVSLSAADDDDRWGKVLAIALTGLLLTDAFTTMFDA